MSAATPLPFSACTWHQQVAHAFSRAAPHYETRAMAQLAMGERLWGQLPVSASQVLDLGCGPGLWSARLAQHYGAHSQVTGMDISPGMLRVARQRYGNQAQWQEGDAAELPLVDNAIDLVFSNLAIQWCKSLLPVMQEIQRVLRPGGLALINTLLPGTLQEVADAWQRPQALLQFHSRQDYLNAAREAGLALGHHQTQAERFFYPNMAAVMASIKGVGAQVARPGKRLTRQALNQATQRYEEQRESQGLPVSYQRLTLRLEKPRS
ncbi:methyltransferase domain-containing protein [Halomonas sediminis]